MKPEILREIAIDHGITWMPVRPCSLCNEYIGYVVLDKYFDNLGLDTSCGCVSYRNISRAEWSNITDYLNQFDEEKQKEILTGWGF